MRVLLACMLMFSISRISWGRLIKRNCEPQQTADGQYVPNDIPENEDLNLEVDDLLDICGSRSTKKFVERIIGGKVSSTGAWPWQVALKQNGEHACGGALITSTWILTAAHCFETDGEPCCTVNPCEWKAVIGENDLTKYSDTRLDASIAAIYTHPKYNDQDDSSHDIALIQLQEAVELNENINAICLPGLHYLYDVGQANLQDCYVAGWGNTVAQPAPEKRQDSNYPDKIRHIPLPILDSEGQKKCAMEYGGIPKSHFCAGSFTGKQDSCDGDSGGPLVCKVQDEGEEYFYQLGVVSFGAGCAAKGFPGVYTSVPYHSDWIKSVMNRYTQTGYADFGAEDENAGYGDFGAEDENAGYGDFGAEDENAGYGDFGAEDENAGYGEYEDWKRDLLDLLINFMKGETNRKK